MNAQEQQDMKVVMSLGDLVDLTRLREAAGATDGAAAVF